MLCSLCPLESQSSSQKVCVEKEATSKLNTTDKVVKTLKDKGEVDVDLGIYLPKLEDSQASSSVKTEKPSLEKLTAACHKLKSSYLMYYFSTLNCGEGYHSPTSQLDNGSLMSSVFR